MRRNLIILIAVAASLAVLVAVFVRQKVAPSSTQTVIMVARSDLAAGTTLAAGDLMWLPVEKTTVPPAAIVRGKGFKELSDVAERRLRRMVLKGEPVLTSSLVNEGDKSLAGFLDPGKRGFSIPVSAQTGVGGFVQPGNLVDVILTYDIKLPNSSGGANPAALIVANSASETVLSNVRVLAVDQEIRDLGKDAKPARTVSLELSPEQVEKVSLAMQMGDLSLSLRSISSDSEPEPTGFTSDVQVGRALRAAVKANNDAMLAAQGITPPPASEQHSEAPAQPAAVSDNTITIYNGGQVSKLRVQGGLR